MPIGVLDRWVRPKRLIAVAGAAAALLLCLLFAVIAWVQATASERLDRTQTQGEAKLLRSLVNDYEKTLSRAVADYSSWTEFYEYLKGPRNAVWENTSLGPYIVPTYDVDAVLIVARDGRAIYTYQRRQKREPNIASDMRAIDPIVMRAFANQVPGVQVPASGFMNIAGVPTMVVASAIRDSSIKAPASFVLVEVRVLNRTALEKLGHDYGIADLRARRRSGRGVALHTPDGGLAPFKLVWQPAAPGRALYFQTLPIVLVIAVIALIALLAMAFVGNRILAQIRSSEQRAMRAELAARDARALAAEETSRGKSAFIANMSHELRTPLNAILGFSELMRSERLGPLGAPKYRDYLDAIHSSGAHLLRIVNDILEISRIEAGKADITIEAVPLAPVIAECVSIMQAMAVPKGIAIDVRVSNPRAEVLADHKALTQVLLNLLANAVKFSPDGSEVVVASREEGGRIELRVSDQGCGIPDDTLKEIGKPFVQAESAYSRKYHGTGLGLSICFLLARAMNGAIHVESREGAGTSVTLVMPKAEPAARNVRQSSAA